MAGEPQVLDSQVDGAEHSPDDDDIEKIWNELEAEDAKGAEEDDQPLDESRDDQSADGAEAGDAEGEQTPPDAVGPAAGTQPKPLTEMTREELLAEREALQQQLQQVRHSDASQRGRISALTRQINELRSQPAAKAGPSIEDQLKQTREEFPELAPVIAVVDELRQETQRARQSQEAAALDENFKAVTKVHPDLVDVLKAHEDKIPAFLEAAPKAVRNAFLENGDAIRDPGDAILAMTSFKQFVGITSPSGGKPAPQKGAPPQQPQGRRERQLVAAAAAPASRGGISPSTSGASGTEEQYWEEFERLDAAKKAKRR